MTYIVQLFVCAGLLFQSPESAAALYQQAREADASGLTQLCHTTCQRIVQQYPDSRFAGPALLCLAEELHRDGKYEGCYELLQDSPIQYSDIQLEKRRKFLISRSALCLANEAESLDTSARWLRRIQWDCFSPDSAELKQAILLTARTPVSASDLQLEGTTEFALRFARAEVLTQAADYETASEQWQLLIHSLSRSSKSKQPTWAATAYLRLGECLLRLKKFEELRTYLDESQRLAEGTVQSELRLLEVQLEIQQIEFERAHQLLDELTQRTDLSSTTQAEIYWRIGELYFLQKNYSAACTAYEQAERFGESVWLELATLQRGKCLELDGRFEEARLAYTTIVKSTSSSEHLKLAESRLQTIEDFRVAQLPQEKSPPTLQR